MTACAPSDPGCMPVATYAWMLGALIVAYFAAWLLWWSWSCQKLERQLRRGEVRQDVAWFTLWPLAGAVPLQHIRMLLVVGPVGAGLWALAALFFAAVAWSLRLPLVLGLLLALFPLLMAGAFLATAVLLRRAIRRAGGLPPR
jgi:hypothetical protein